MSCRFHRMVESFKASRACHNLQIINSLRGGSQMIHRNYGTTMNTDSWKWPNLARVPKPLKIYPPLTIQKLLL